MALKRSKGCIVNPIVPHRIIAGTFGMAAFAVAVVCGLWVENPASSILIRALGALVVCYSLGLVVGWICEYVVREHLALYKQTNPIPRSDQDLDRLSEAKGRPASG